MLDMHFTINPVTLSKYLDKVVLYDQGREVMALLTKTRNGLFKGSLTREGVIAYIDYCDSSGDTLCTTRDVPKPLRWVYHQAGTVINYYSYRLDDADL